jgi:hypothetical protein
MPVVAVMMRPGSMARMFRDNYGLFRRLVRIAKLFGHDSSVERSLPFMLNVFEDDVVIVNLASKLVDTADYQTKHDDSNHRIRPDETFRNSSMWDHIAKSQGQNGDVGEIQRVSE